MKSTEKSTATLALWMDVDAAWWKALDDANREHRRRIAKREAEKLAVDFAGVRLVERVER